MSAIKNISLFIPHVYGNYTSSMVCDIFDKMNIGLVKNVDFVHKMGSDGKAYNAAYIHFHEWYDNVVARNFQERVLHPDKEARVMYDDPWYWIVLENKGKKHVPGERKPRIDLDAFTELKTKPTAGFDCGHTPEKEVAKPSPYLTPKQFKKAAMDVIYAPKKAKSWANVVQPTPVKLDNHFNEEITQEEMDKAFEEMEEERELNEMMAEMEAEIEMEDSHLISIDGRYVESLEQDNEMLRSQLAYFQNLYNMEIIKSQALIDTIKNLKV